MPRPIHHSSSAVDLSEGQRRRTSAVPTQMAYELSLRRVPAADRRSPWQRPAELPGVPSLEAVRQSRAAHVPRSDQL